MAPTQSMISHLPPLLTASWTMSLAWPVSPLKPRKPTFSPATCNNNHSLDEDTDCIVLYNALWGDTFNIW